MKVEQAMRLLQGMDPEADMGYLYDGMVHGAVDHIYMSKLGTCVTAAAGSVAYCDDGRPVSAPDTSEEPYWYTPEKEEQIQ